MIRRHYFILKIFIAGLIIAGGVGHANALAANLSYDRYAQTGEYRKESALKKTLLRLPAAPFEIIKWPLDKLLVYVEKNHVDDKVIWIYERLQDRGLSPYLHFINPSKLTYGTGVDFVRLFKQKHRVPDLILKGGVKHSEGHIFNVYGKAGWNRIADSGLSFYNLVQYERRMDEHFYGIGPESSRGEGHVYGTEMTKIEPTLQYELSPVLKTDVSFSYRNININGGKDGGRGQVGEGVFSSNVVPGLSGDSLITVGWGILHDTRNQKEHSSEGGSERFRISYVEGLNSSQARYLTYETELTRYIKLGSERRVLALHFYGEHNDEINNGNIPFHQMPKLGGYGASPHQSHALRGYDFNRFTDESVAVFNIEYRYNIWQYRRIFLDAVAFFEEGQVFGEFSEMKLDNFRESYGGGFRINIANISILNIEIAHADEGTNFYVKSRSPF